jgi:hypothetical protein
MGTKKRKPWPETGVKEPGLPISMEITEVNFIEYYCSR